MSERRANCVCGQLAVTVEDEPVRVSVCHCLECQRRTGSAFGVQARYEEAKVKTAGRSSTFVRTGDSGGRVEYRFCPDCGTTMCWTIERLPGFVAVAVGAFADPSFPGPVAQYFEERRHGWVHLDT